MDMTDKHPFENTKQQAYEVHYFNELEKQKQRGIWARIEAYEAQICGAVRVSPGFMVQKTKNPNSE